MTMGDLSATMISLDNRLGIVYDEDGNAKSDFMRYWRPPGSFDTEIDLEGDWYFMDLGSTMVFGGFGSDPSVKVPDILRSVETMAKDNWHWFTEDAAIVEAGVIQDNRKFLWISFDSKDDAMLSKMTLLGLRNQKYADHRRLSGSSE